MKVLLDSEWVFAISSGTPCVVCRGGPASFKQRPGDLYADKLKKHQATRCADEAIFVTSFTLGHTGAGHYVRKLA